MYHAKNSEDGKHDVKMHGNKELVWLQLLQTNGVRFLGLHSTWAIGMQLSTITQVEVTIKTWKDSAKRLVRHKPFRVFLKEPSGSWHFLLAMKWLPCWKAIESRSSTFVDLISWVETNEENSLQSRSRGLRFKNLQ